MASLRIEFLKIQQSNKELDTNPDNVIGARVAASIDLTITGTVTVAGNRPVVPTGCNGVRLTSVGGVACVDWGQDPTATQLNSLRLIADQPEVVAMKRGSLISAMVGA